MARRHQHSEYIRLLDFGKLRVGTGDTWFEDPEPMSIEYQKNTSLSRIRPPISKEYMTWLKEMGGSVQKPSQNGDNHFRPGTPAATAQNRNWWNLCCHGIDLTTVFKYDIRDFHVVFAMDPE